MTFARRVFAAAGAIGVVFVLPLYFLEARISGKSGVRLVEPSRQNDGVGLLSRHQICNILGVLCLFHFQELVIDATHDMVIHVQNMTGTLTQANFLLI